MSAQALGDREKFVLVCVAGVVAIAHGSTDAAMTASRSAAIHNHGRHNNLGRVSCG